MKELRLTNNRSIEGNDECMNALITVLESSSVVMILGLRAPSNLGRRSYYYNVLHM